MELIVGEIYYFETTGEYLGEKSDVAEYNEKGWFCCSWGGVPANSPFVKNIRMATHEEVEQWEKKWEDSGWDHMDSLFNKAFTDIKAELSRAREKHPTNGDMLPAVVEEVGEVTQALMEQKREGHKGISSEEIYKEAIQVAVTAIRLAVEGDSNFPDYLPPRHRPSE